MRLMSSGNNVKHCDTSCKSAIKMPSLLLITRTETDNYFLFSKRLVLKWWYETS